MIRLWTVADAGQVMSCIAICACKSAVALFFQGSTDLWVVPYHVTPLTDECREKGQRYRQCFGCARFVRTYPTMGGLDVDGDWFCMGCGGTP